MSEYTMLDKMLESNTIIQKAYKAPTDPELFALSRRFGLGASDSASVLKLNKYIGRNKLIKNKCLTVWTEEEQMIGRVPAVKAGVEAEAAILRQAGELLNSQIFKPRWTYQFIDHPYQFVNFDGVTTISGSVIPIEAKWTTEVGEQHYDKKLAFYDGQNFQQITRTQPEGLNNNTWRLHAAFRGVPVNYWIQIQLQMAALGSNFGYLARWSERFKQYMLHEITANQDFMHVYWEAADSVWKEIEEKRGPHWSVDKLPNGIGELQ